MSSYCKAKVLRLPVEPDDLGLKDDWQYDFEEAFPDITGWFDPGKFMTSCTKDLFLDYVISYDWDSSGEYGKVRALYESEKERFMPQFKKIIPDVNMDNVKVVEFSWYNSVDAPGYYDNVEDEFYSEIF